MPCSRWLRRAHAVYDIKKAACFSARAISSGGPVNEARSNVLRNPEVERALAELRNAGFLTAEESLDAALDAHRRANNASHIRRLALGTDPDVLRPDAVGGDQEEESFLQRSGRKQKLTAGTEARRRRTQDHGASQHDDDLAFNVSNGFLGRQRANEYLQKRKLLLQECEITPPTHLQGPGPTPTEHDWTAQMNILRRVRQALALRHRSPEFVADLSHNSRLRTERNKLAGIMEYRGRVIEMERKGRNVDAKEPPSAEHDSEPWRVITAAKAMGISRYEGTVTHVFSS